MKQVQMFQSHNLITFNLLTEILIIHTLFFITRCDAHTMHLQQSFLLCFFSEISRSNFLSYFNKLINKYNKTDKKSWEKISEATQAVVFLLQIPREQNYHHVLRVRIFKTFFLQWKNQRDAVLPVEGQRSNKNIFINTIYCLFLHWR